jgi:hypothetical protein
VQPLILGMLVVASGTLLALVLVIAAIATARRPQEAGSRGAVASFDPPEPPRLPYAAALSIVFIASAALLFYPTSLVWHSAIGLLSDSRQFRTEAASGESYLGLYLAIAGIVVILIGASIAVRSIARRNKAHPAPALLLGAALAVAAALGVLVWVALSIFGVRSV